MRARAFVVQVLALVMLFALPFSVAAQVATPTTTGREAMLQDVLERHLAAEPSIPGLLLSVAVPGFAWSGSAGVADRATDEPLTSDQTFRVASNTKTFTAAATLRLVEDGAIELDRPILGLLPIEFLEALRGDGYDPERITVRHLLTHTSGLYDYGEDPVYQETVLSDMTKRWIRFEQVQFAMEHGDPLGAPGEAFHYSDTGYVLLGAIIEGSTGESLAAAYRSLLDFAGLGLDATYLETEELVPPGAGERAHQYYGEIDTFDADPSFDLYGGGGLVSSTGDLVRFYRALVRGEVFHDPVTIETMLTIPAASRLSEAAMGIFRTEVAGLTCWEHDGFWGTAAFHCPDADVTFAISINQALPGEAFDGERLIGDVLAIVSGGS
jgi:D-alanyl-D-alanine carboxypeptidase